MIQKFAVIGASIVLSLLLLGCLSQAESPPFLKADSSTTIVYPMYHDPSFGWTASVPSGWISCNIPGGQFNRGSPLTDPTRLIIWTYLNRSVDDIQTDLTETGGVTDLTVIGELNTRTLHWVRYRGGARSDPQLAVELAIAAQEPNAHLVLLVAKKSEVEALVGSVLLPVVDSFLPGQPEQPFSILSVSPTAPDYWPVPGWRSASPASQGMEEEQLGALVARIRQEALPIDSLTVVRHGYLVMNETFSYYQTDDLHELHSVTKSITSALVGIALHDASLPVETPVLEVLSPWHAARIDERKQAMTLEHLLTMTAGLDWTEWGAAYESGTGNDLVTMVEYASDWTQFILDRPMAAVPGEVFLYNSGSSYLLSAVVSQLAEMSAADFAAKKLFTPLGIKTSHWPSGPEGVTTGWGGLRLSPEDLARIGLLYLQRGRWDDQQLIPSGWVEASTIDHVTDPFYEYGYQWWLDTVDGYAYMSGRFGQTVIVAPKQDMVIVIMASLPDNVSGAGGVPRWLAETYIFPAINQP